MPVLSTSAVRPNPFADEATLPFELRQAGRVTARVYDLLGREVTTLMEAALPAGRHQTRWDGRTTGGRRAAPGVYFLRLRSGDAVATARALLLP